MTPSTLIGGLMNAAGLRSPLTSMGKTTACPLLPLLIFYFVFSSCLFSRTGAADNIDQAASLRDGQTLVSAGGNFQLGFFSIAGGTTRRYLCIRSTKGQEQPIVWVANREQALNDSSGVLRFGRDGNLAVLDKGGGIVWSTRLAPNVASNLVAKLLDTGNLVVGEAGDDLPTGRFLWQSFDEPGNTLIPGMRILLNRRTGVSRHLTSWKSLDDPSPGRYSYRLDINILPRLVLMDGSTMLFSTGPWIGARFTGTATFNANSVFNTSLVFSGDEVYYVDTMIGNSGLLRLLLEPTGTLRRSTWTVDTGSWVVMWWAPLTCESFARCGPFGVCTDGSFPFCRCPRGFRPRSQEKWNLGNATDGCVRNTKLGCGTLASFLMLTQLKLPELDGAAVDMGMSLEECRDRCARNCSCTAYARADYREGGRGCIIWSGGPLNTWTYSNTNDGQQLYLKVLPSDLDPEPTDSHNKRTKQALVVSLSAVFGTVLLASCGFWIYGKRTKKAKIDKASTSTMEGRSARHNDESVHGEDTELPLFDYATIESATNNFWFRNKIGEGGFGMVYKGTLDDGQEIAVKRLSWTSVQGLNEFMNEVKLIVKLQHKNLVRLLGCCTWGEERMLIYEYMQNQSLDLFIFDDKKRGLLDWRMRLDIILGIARGLLYLHHDSRFKIIHRDLKAANILLDGVMNPKISDFGTARIFGADQLTDNTKRVIGTYGYMSPEYAINGIISVKSDVFSFGVLVLEVLSGIKNRGIYAAAPHVNLLSHAWKLWQEGNGLELLDPLVTGACTNVELLRCIQVGLLCVQELAVNRPTMFDVVMMLGSENFPLPQPKKPGFIIFRSPYSSEITSSSQHESSTTNELTLTSILDGR